MQIGPFDLTYCSNIHAGESWDEVQRALAGALPRIRAGLAFDGPFAVGLRLSAAAAETLDDPATFDAFRDFLAAGDYYVPTINGFPYGAFHGTRVKDRVYLPDWRSPERVAYTNRLANLLSRLLDGRRDTVGSVSTVPVGFQVEMASRDDIAAAATNILRHAAYLKRLRDERGVTIALAIEPEPACLLETADDAAAFFETHLLRTDVREAAARAEGTPLGEEDVRTHVGVCLDTCHMAVEFEDAAASVQRLDRSGIQVRKVQISSALQMRPGVHPLPADVLGPFADDTYLHQVVVRGAHGLVRYTDLPEALAHAGSRSTGEWRVHFHVPVFLEDLPGTSTTQAYVRSVLDLLRRQPFCPVLEVETYTWDVLPPEHRTTDVCTAIARELSWVAQSLRA